MKKRGKNNEQWWTREKKTRKNDEKEWKKTMKHDEKEIKKNKETLWKIQKQQWKMMKNRGTNNEQWWKREKKQCKIAKRSNILSCDYFNFRIFYLVGARPCVFDILSCPD